MFGKRDWSGPARKGRLMIHETTLENDIRYRGPFSYQHFKMLGWLCIVISQIAMIVRLGARVDAGRSSRAAPPC